MSEPDRTTCACRQCTDCCTSQPGCLQPGDFERIAEFLGQTPEQARRSFVASPGALLGRETPKGFETFRIGTITPRMKGGRCVFLDVWDKCRIHPVAPYGCAYFDTHMSKAEAQPRSLAMLKRVAGSQEYQELRASLPVANSWRPRPY